MKFHASRYGLTAALGSLASSSVVTCASDGTTQLVIALFMAAFIGICCALTVPYDTQGDK